MGEGLRVDAHDVPRLKARPAHLLHRLGHDAPAPEGPAQPVAQLGRPAADIRAPGEGHAAHGLSIHHDGPEYGLLRLRRPAQADELLRV